MATIINCTGMDLLIGTGSGDDHEYVDYPAAKVPARVLKAEVVLPGLDVLVVRDTGVDGLPAPEEGVFCLVTSRVAMAALATMERDDLLIPAGLREWGDGRRKVVGELLRPNPHLRGWGHGLPDLVSLVAALGDYNGVLAQVSAERSQDGTWMVDCDAPVGADGSPMTQTGLTRDQAMRAFGEVVPIAQQWVRAHAEQQDELL